MSLKEGYYISGKTTLADALVASNGIISQRMAGKVFLKIVTKLQHTIYVSQLLQKPFK